MLSPRPLLSGSRVYRKKDKYFLPYALPLDCYTHNGKGTPRNIPHPSMFNTKKDKLFSKDTCLFAGLPWWCSSKESASNLGATGDVGWTPGSGRSPGGGNGNPLQYSCLENPMDRGDWGVTVHEVAKSRTQLKRLSMHLQGVSGLHHLTRTGHGRFLP